VRVHIRLFASHREILGADRLDVELPVGASVADLVDVIAERVPGVKRTLGSTRFAVNREYASSTTILHEGDEVALIPPVAGGRD